MSLTRRNFILNTTYVGAGFAVTGGINPLMAHAATEPVDLTPYLTGIRMAATPATDYRAYRSKVVASPDITTWVQVDRGKSFPIDAIQLFPASERSIQASIGTMGARVFPFDSTLKPRTTLVSASQ